MTRLPLIAAVLLGSGCNEYDLTVFEGVDVFFQNPAAQVDVLLVVDDSGSMRPYQLLLGARFHEFLTYFEQVDVDYHIGVVTTTVENPTWPGSGCDQGDLDALSEPGELHLGTVLTPDTPDAADVFNDLVNVGACGSGDEQGLEGARLALSPAHLAGPNAGFIRPEAHLSIVFLSDEQDFSPAPVHDYINAFYDLKGQRARDVVNASGIVITSADDCIIPAAGSTEGTRYVEVIEQTGGVVGNLCNTDFQEIVTEISFNASRLRDTYFISESPAVGSLQVSVGDQMVDCAHGAWTYAIVEDHGVDKPAIIFNRAHMPLPGEQIAVRYNLGSGDPADFCPTEPM